MKKLALVACLLLAGCTDSDWDRALNYAHLSGAPAETASMEDAPVTPTSVAPRPVAQTVAAAPAPVDAAPAAPANSDFCRAVATADATGNGFDPATQQRVFAQSYAQCVAIYTR